MPYVETREYAEGVRRRLEHVGGGAWDITGGTARAPTRPGMSVERARHLADLHAVTEPVGPWRVDVDALQVGDRVPCLHEDGCPGTMTFEVGPDPNTRDGSEALFARCSAETAHLYVAGVYR